MTSIRYNVPVFVCVAIVVCALAEAAQGQEGPSASITPGKSVGLLHLGDSRERVQKVFPFKKNMDQEWAASNKECGTTFLWVELKPNYGGNVFVHLRDGVVFQIDSATESFRTTSGVTVRAPPRDVRKRVPGLRAYVLSEGTSEAYGMRPLTYWVDKAKGIAFAFGYSRSEQSWGLVHTIVFHPDAEICPEPEPLSSSEKRELPAYSLDPKEHESSPRR